MPRSRRLAAVPEVDPDLDTPAPAMGGNISGERLRSLIERIERLEAERKTIAADIKEIKAEAKGAGFDVKVVNFLIRERRLDKDDVDEFNTLVDVYKRAIGMVP